ncbi:hypothetical protein M0R45_007635 [Rubus argutus]|uniref:Uncharacterized protein n=1 Tax=Rubus argutus TaxID=59490 RepID=A0AAW1XZA6_RUBAR
MHLQYLHLSSLIPLLLSDLLGPTTPLRPPLAHLHYRSQPPCNPQSTRSSQSLVSTMFGIPSSCPASQLTHSAALPTPTSPSDALIAAGVSIHHKDPSPLPCNSP